MNHSTYRPFCLVFSWFIIRSQWAIHKYWLDYFILIIHIKWRVKRLSIVSFWIGLLVFFSFFFLFIFFFILLFFLFIVFKILLSIFFSLLNTFNSCWPSFNHFNIFPIIVFNGSHMMFYFKFIFLICFLLLFNFLKVHFFIFEEIFVS